MHLQGTPAYEQRPRKPGHAGVRANQPPEMPSVALGGEKSIYCFAFHSSAYDYC